MRIRMISNAFVRPTMDHDPTDSISIGDSASTGSFFENNPQDRVSFDQTEQMILQNMMKEKKAKKKSSNVARVRSSSGVEGKRSESTGAKFSDSMATTLTEMMSPYDDSPSVASLTNSVVSARSSAYGLTLVQPIKRRLSIEEKNAFKLTESTGDFSKSGHDSFSSLDGLTFSSNPNAVVRPSPAGSRVGIMKRSYSLNRMRSTSQRSLSSVGENEDVRKVDSREPKNELSKHLGQTVVQFELQKDDHSATENSIDPMTIFKETREKSSVREKKMKKSKSKKSTRSVSSVETSETPVPALEQSPSVREKKMKKSKSKKSTRDISSVNTSDTTVAQGSKLPVGYSPTLRENKVVESNSKKSTNSVSSVDSTDAPVAPHSEPPLHRSPALREKKMKKSKSKMSTRSVSSVDTADTPVAPRSEPSLSQSLSTKEKKRKKKKDKKSKSGKDESADDVLARWNSKIEQLEQERAATDSARSTHRSPVPRLCADSERVTIELSISEHSLGRPSVSRNLSMSCMSTASSSLSGDETSRHGVVRRPSLTTVFAWGRETSASNLNADMNLNAEMNLIMTKSTVPDRRKCLRKSRSTTDINHYNRTTTWPSRRSTRNLHAQFYHRSTNLPTSDTVDRSTESSPVVTARQILDVMEPVTPREVMGFNGLTPNCKDEKLRRKTSINYGEILDN